MGKWYTREQSRCCWQHRDMVEKCVFGDVTVDVYVNGGDGPVRTAQSP
jgi:hypothetical protein